MFRRGNHSTPISLALQGGGAHGAFTWGVLDALLEDGRFPVSAVSATSAGAMNAVALAHGFAAGGADGAREALATFWRAVGTSVSFDGLLVGSSASPGFAPAARLFMHWASLMSPLQLNPLGLNPLREVLVAQIDFERLRRADAIRLFIAATHANRRALAEAEAISSGSFPMRTKAALSALATGSDPGADCLVVL